jgi:hypothetical protein
MTRIKVSRRRPRLKDIRYGRAIFVPHPVILDVDYRLCIIFNYTQTNLGVQSSGDITSGVREPKRLNTTVVSLTLQLTALYPTRRLLVLISVGD